MAEYTLIAAGGTGIKTANALLTILCTGFNPFKKDDRLTIVNVDIDINSAQKARFDALYSQYQRLKRYLGDTLPNIAINSFQINGQPLSTVAGSIGESEERRLFEHLFTGRQRAENNNVGTKGDTQRGSFMAARADFDVFIQSILPNLGSTPYRIIFAGGIFGGSGASITPTFYQIFKKKLADKAGELGLVLVLPYFMYPNPTGDEGVRTGEHIARTKEALQEYKSMIDDPQMSPDYVAYVGGAQRHMYSIADGESSATESDASLGGDLQLNPIMPEDIVAALSCVFFFRGDNKIINQNQATPVKEVYCETSGYRMCDMPYGAELSKHMKAFNQFLHLFRYYYIENDNGQTPTAFNEYRPTNEGTMSNHYYDIVGFPQEAVDTTDKEEAAKARNRNRNNLLSVFNEIVCNTPNYQTDLIGRTFGMKEDLKDIKSSNKRYYEWYRKIDKHIKRNTNETSNDGKQREFIRQLYNECNDKHYTW